MPSLAWKSERESAREREGGRGRERKGEGGKEIGGGDKEQKAR